MKRIFSILLLQIFVLGFIFAASINSKQGYKGLAWGSSINDAKKAGYKLTPINAPNNLYQEPVEAYKANSKDKSVSSLQFHYHNGRLFFVSETLSSNNFSRQKLESRYGNFSKQGIYLAGQQYTDATRENNGVVSALSIIISNSSGNIVAKLYDWNVYKRISYAGQQLSQGQKTAALIVTRLQNMANILAEELIEEKGGKDSPTLAILALTTDYGNEYVEEHITDALTEAMYNTSKITIYEREALDRALQELNFQESRYVDQKTAKQIGNFIGVDFVCYGTIKDSGERLTIKTRVENVKTAEICAMSSATIAKDDYLKTQPQSEVKKTRPKKTSSSASKPSQTSSASPVKTAASKADNAWKAKSWRNDFDGYAQYLFKVYSTDEKFVFISYQKCDIKANSRVITGVYWGNEGWFGSDIKGRYDIKSKEGTVSVNFNDAVEKEFDPSGKEKFWFVWNQKDGSRLLAERFKNNETVALRRDGLTRRFQTAGLLDKMAEYGITWTEIDAAIANEEF